MGVKWKERKIGAKTKKESMSSGLNKEKIQVITNTHTHTDYMGQ